MIKKYLSMLIFITISCMYPKNREKIVNKEQFYHKNSSVSLIYSYNSALSKVSLTPSVPVNCSHKIYKSRQCISISLPPINTLHIKPLPPFPIDKIPPKAPLSIDKTPPKAPLSIDKTPPTMNIDKTTKLRHL